MKNKVISLFFVLVICIGVFIGYPFVKYYLAKSYLQNGYYEKAKASFISLNSFKDSNEYVIECDYQNAISYKEQGDYTTAIELLESIGEYKDSIEQIKDSVEQIDERQYLDAKLYIEKKDYSSALRFLKELEDYKDVNELIKDCTYNKALLLIEEENYDDAITYLNEIKDYKDVDNQIKDATYQKGVKYYELGSFSTACNTFANLKGYKDSDELFKKSKHMTNYIGTWETKYSFSEVVISGWDITNIYNISNKNSSQYTFDFKLLEDGSIDTDYTLYRINSNYDTLVGYKRDYSSGKLDTEGEVYTKVSTSVYVPDERVEPYIGMSRDELEESSWGKPEDINKTTTSYGVNEQWCYSGYRYVYLEDGIVTSIQE